jgi:hypothetical protein
MLLCYLFHRSKIDHSGVSENDVNSSLRLDGLVKTIEIGRFGNVSLNASDVVSDFLYSFVEFLLATACDNTKAPSRTKSFAVANPMPEVPPVMTATFPANFAIIGTPSASSRVTLIRQTKLSAYR